MSNRGLFSKRLKLLRKSHGVLSHELADVLGNKHRGIISRFENNKNMPSFDSLIQIADLFAVSLDWLLGRVNDPYNEKVLTSLEEKYAVPLLSIALEKAAIPLPKIYTRTDLRRKNYTHGQRANIIFTVLSSYYTAWNSNSKTMAKEVDSELLKDNILVNLLIDRKNSLSFRKIFYDAQKAKKLE